MKEMEHSKRNRNWDMKEGFLIGGGILLAGILLQLLAGPVRWEKLAFPVNLILLTVFLAALIVMYALRRKVRLFEWMMHLQAAVPALCYALGLTIIMGLVTQREEGGGIPWLSQMLDFWPFVLSYSWMMVIVGLATINHLLRFRLREIPFLLNHLGLFMALVCGAIGAPDSQRLHMTTREGETESRAEDENGVLHDVGLSIGLHDFIMEEFPLQEGQRRATPKRFASDVTVYTKNGESIDAVIEVNKPLKVGRWKIYQYDYDEEKGTESRISVLELVSDPWLPFILTGIYMMLAGALCLFFFMAPRPGKKEDKP